MGDWGRPRKLYINTLHQRLLLRERRTRPRSDHSHQIRRSSDKKRQDGLRQAVLVDRQQRGVQR